MKKTTLALLLSSLFFVSDFNINLAQASTKQDLKTKQAQKTVKKSTKNKQVSKKQKQHIQNLDTQFPTQPLSSNNLNQPQTISLSPEDMVLIKEVEDKLNQTDFIHNSLSFNVEEDLKISGNSFVETDKIKNNLSTIFKNEAQLNVSSQAYAYLVLKNELLGHYAANGYHNATIHEDVFKTKTNKNGFEMKVDEKEPTYINDVHFYGNKDFTKEDLLDEIHLQPRSGKFWGMFDKKLSQQEFNFDIERLQDFYLNKGYLNFQVLEKDDQGNNTQVLFTDVEKKDYADVHFVINEGNKYNISSVSLTGNLDDEHKKEIQEKYLKDFESGQLFTKNFVMDVEEGIKAVLGHQGYGVAKIDVIPTFENDNTVSLNFQVDKGQVFTVRKIIFEGQEKSQEKMLRKNMRQEENSVLSTTNTSVGKLLLDRTGFFNSVDIEYHPVSETQQLNVSGQNEIDVVYKLNERRTNSFNIGIGYDTEGGMNYNFGLKHENFFGHGSTVAFDASKNDNSLNFNLGYEDPYVTDKNLRYKANVFYNNYNNNDNNEADYKRTSYGFDNTLGFSINDDNGFYVGFGITRDVIKNVEREYHRENYIKTNNLIDEQAYINGNLYPKIKATDIELKTGFTHNSLNKGYMPTKGTLASLNLGFTSIGSTNKYYQIGADFRNYLPLTRDHKWIISAKGSINMVKGLKGKEAPFYQWYSAGGFNTVRGFSYGSIGPKALYLDNNGQFTNASNDVIGGNMMATGSLELITPLPFIKEQQNLRFSFFTDAAKVWNRNKKINIENSNDDKIRVSAGAALQWHSPIGLLSFSYAKPIKKYDNDEVENFQFSLGGTF